MKGQSRFAGAEAASIRVALLELRSARRPEQKKIRDGLRKELDFYITDFDESRQGFTAEQFDDLVSRGIIGIS